MADHHIWFYWFYSVVLRGKRKKKELINNFIKKTIWGKRFQRKAMNFFSFNLGFKMYLAQFINWRSSTQSSTILQQAFWLNFFKKLYRHEPHICNKYEIFYQVGFLGICSTHLLQRGNYTFNVRKIKNVLTWRLANVPMI
jgi:hypothetical protein